MPFREAFLSLFSTAYFLFVMLRFPQNSSVQFLTSAVIHEAVIFTIQYITENIITYEKIIKLFCYCFCRFVINFLFFCLSLWRFKVMILQSSYSTSWDIILLSKNLCFFQTIGLITAAQLIVEYSFIVVSWRFFTFFNT